MAFFMNAREDYLFFFGVLPKPQNSLELKRYHPISQGIGLLFIPSYFSILCVFYQSAPFNFDDIVNPARS